MRLVFVGTGAIGVPTLSALISRHQVVGVVTQPDKPAGRDQRVLATPIKQIALRAAANVFQPPRIREPSAVNQIGQWNPDAVVVIAYGQILPGAILKVPRLACLNVHASLLPRWRGAAPVQAAIAAGDEQTGLTLMYMDEGLDTGDILLQRQIEVSATDTGGTIHDRLAGLAPQATLEALDLLEKGTAPRRCQDSALATYAPKLDRDAGRIDWHEPAQVIERKIRAFNPWPGSFTQLESRGGVRKIKVFAVQVADAHGPPGTLISSDSELVIAAGTGALRLVEVQLEGRKRMPAVDLIRGNQWIKDVDQVS